MTGRVTVVYRPFRRGAENSRALLTRAVERYVGVSGLGVPVETPQGKPFFPTLPELGCSVTHSGDFWLCALARQPLGLDLQRHKTHSPPEKLSKRFFHPTEHEWLAREDFRRFFDVWAAKESYLKYTGEGLSGGLRSFSVVSPDGDFPKTEGADLRLLTFRAGYSLCLCAERIGEVALLEF